MRLWFAVLLLALVPFAHGQVQPLQLAECSPGVPCGYPTPTPNTCPVTTTPNGDAACWVFGKLNYDFLTLSGGGTNPNGSLGILYAGAAAYAGGAKCDGVTDDGPALTAFVAAVQANQRTGGAIPGGTCLTSVPLTITGKYFDIGGAGQYATNITYTGTSPATSPFNITGSSLSVLAGNGALHDLTLTPNPNVQMTGGCTLAMTNVAFLHLYNITVDGQFGPHTSNNVACLQSFGQIEINNYDFCGATNGDGLQVAGQIFSTAPQYDLFVYNGKTCLNKNGLHLAGGIDGIYVDSTKNTKNVIGILVDHAVAAFGTQKVTIGPTYTIEEAVTDAIQLNDTLTSVALHSTIDIDGPLETSGRFNVVFTAPPQSGDTSGTLTTNWPNATGAYAVTFSDGELRTVSAITGSPEVSWAGGLSGAVTVNALTVGNGLNIVNFPNASVDVKAGHIIWNKNGCGVLIQDPLANVSIDQGTQITQNLCGVNATLLTSNVVAINPSSVYANVNNPQVNWTNIVPPSGVVPSSWPANADQNSIGVGLNALAALSSQTPAIYEDTALGFDALLSNTTGTFNTAVGAGALKLNTTGSNNTAFGKFTLLNSVTGTDATAIGSGALLTATGGGNTALGFAAGQAETTGSNNTFVGKQVGSSTCATGQNNLMVGTSILIDCYAAATSNELNIANAIRGGKASLASGALSSCGTSPAISSTATDLAGTITTGSGATACTLTLAQSNSVAPTCLVTARSGTAPVYSTTDNGTTATLVLSTAAAAATYDYWCPVH